MTAMTINLTNGQEMIQAPDGTPVGHLVRLGWKTIDQPAPVKPARSGRGKTPAGPQPTEPEPADDTDTDDDGEETTK